MKKSGEEKSEPDPLEHFTCASCKKSEPDPFELFTCASCKKSEPDPFELFIGGLLHSDLRIGGQVKVKVIVEQLKTAREAVIFGLTGTAIGAVSTAAVSWKYSKSPNVKLLKATDIKAKSASIIENKGGI